MFNLKCTNKKSNYYTPAFVIGVLGLLMFSSCKDEVLPKPSSYLRLDYPVA
ncbi:MAG: gliding motility lipoprotein GldD, partial [Flavobacteriales bacterium 32-34-25]